MNFTDSQLSCDSFLGGKISIWQPIKGYRAATDPVFLAASVGAKSGQSVLELGCGAGVASLCLGCRIPGLSMVGVEFQPQYGELARKNAAANGQEFPVFDADLADLPPELRQLSFDHVIANPPFLIPGAGSPAKDTGKEAAFRELTPLADWIDVAIKRLKPRGYLTLIHQAERLPEILRELGSRMGDVEVKPITARQNQSAGRVVLRARKGGHAPFRLHAPLLVHSGVSHQGDGDDYSKTAQDILRNGAALEF